MSDIRQLDEGVLVRSFGLTFSVRTLSPPASETWDQLVYAIKGVLTVKSDSGIWVVPPHRAVWLPAHTRYSLSMAGQTALRMIYLPVASRPPDRASCSVVNVTPLLRELIVRTTQIGALESAVPIHLHIAALIQDELATIETVPIQLPSPQSELSARFATLFETEIGAKVEALLAQCGASRRTMERLFAAETGMGLGQWIRRRKLLFGLERILDGETVASVAFELGYSSPSAFIAMFKRELGSPPSRYLSAEARRVFP